MTLDEINIFFEILAQKNPTPLTELEYKDPYTLLVAVVLSAQSTDKGVNKATKILFQKADTPQKMVELGEAVVKEAIKTLGFYNMKAKNVIKLSEILLEKYQGKVPEDRVALEELPGVGRKTANVVLNVIFQQPTMPVDTHVFRVANRTGMAIGKSPLEVETLLEKRIPARWMPYAHHWLILHGRYICKARKPLCEICPVSQVCDYYKGLKAL